jgi:hypothetical protein
MSYRRRRFRRFLLQGLCLPAAFCEPCIPDKIARLAAAISVQEGWNNPKSLVRRQHNPGALIFVGQRAAQLGKNGYARFKTDQDGKNALVADLRAKTARGMTLGRIMDRWSVKSYAAIVVRETGLNINEILTAPVIDLCTLRDLHAPAKSQLAGGASGPISLRAAGFQLLAHAATPFALPVALPAALPVAAF